MMCLCMTLVEKLSHWQGASIKRLDCQACTISAQSSVTASSQLTFTLNSSNLKAWDHLHLSKKHSQRNWNLIYGNCCVTISSRYFKFFPIKATLDDNSPATILQDGSHYFYSLLGTYKMWNHNVSFCVWIMYLFLFYNFIIFIINI